MKYRDVWQIAALAALAVLGIGSPSLQAAEEDGVALAILYDTSGSMKDAVPDKDGKPAPKYLIANRALIAIAKQVQAFATNASSGAARRIDAGLFIFSSPGAREVVKFGPFDSSALETWARNFANPMGNTRAGAQNSSSAMLCKKVIHFREDFTLLPS